MAVLVILLQIVVFFLQLGTLFLFTVVGAVAGLALSALVLDRVTTNNIFDDIFLLPSCGLGALIGILSWGAVWNSL